MKTTIVSLPKYLLILTVALIGWDQALANRAPLSIVGTAMVWGSACDQEFPKLLAGSSYFLRITNHVDRTLEPLILGWPQGYILEAALDVSEGQPFASTAGLIERLAPVPYIDIVSRAYEHDLLEGKSNVNPEKLNRKCFVIHIPSDLVGHTLTFRASYNDTLISNPTQAISIIQPCDISDTSTITATRVLEAYRIADYIEAIELADSMVNHNLSNAAAWRYARLSAEEINQYEKAIFYLDRIFEEYGVISTAMNAKALIPLNNGDAQDPEIYSTYQRHHSTLLQKKAEYEQQQR